MWLPTLGDGRQSGTSDSPSILNVSPESAAGGGLAWLRTGDIIRVDLNAGTCDALVEPGEIARRLAETPTPPIPESATPWEELFREKTGQLGDGAGMVFALKYRATSRKLTRPHHRVGWRAPARAAWRRRGARLPASMSIKPYQPCRSCGAWPISAR